MAVAKMIDHGWPQEVDANLRRGEPLWRETGDGHGTRLVVADVGLLAIGIEPVVLKAVLAIRERVIAEPVAKPPAPCTGTKQALLVFLAEGGCLGICTDSNVGITAARELCLLEYG